MSTLASPPVDTKPIASQSIDRVAELRETVSASRLSLWHQCKLKFYFRHVLSIMKAPSPAQHLGRVVHSVLQAWNMARWRKELFALERFKELLDRDWTEQQKLETIRWADEEEKQRQLAWAMLQTYFTQTPIPAGEKPLGVEVRIEADLSSHGLPTLRGILDLVRAGGQIVDYKSVGKTPDAEKAAHLHETQISSYALLYRAATGAKETAIELHHLVKLKTPKLIVTSVEPMSEKQETRLFRSIESYVDGLGRRDFVPSPGLHCSCCEYFNECRDRGGTEGYG